jgi:cytochrome c5
MNLPSLTRSNMNKSKQPKLLLQTIFATVITAVVISGLASALCSAEPKSDAPPPKTDTAPSGTNSVQPKASSPDTKKAPVKRQLSGAELYSMHCNRCHPERYPTERTAAQWKTIMLHMRVRANLPAEQARTVLKYLQDNSGR